MSQNMSLESIEKYVYEAKVTEVTKENIVELGRLAALSKVNYSSKAKDRKALVKLIPQIADAIYSTNLIPGLRNIIPELEKDFEYLNQTINAIGDVVKYVSDINNYTKTDDVRAFFNDYTKLSSAVSTYSRWNSANIKKMIKKDTVIYELTSVFEICGKLLALNLNFISLTKNDNDNCNNIPNYNSAFFNHSMKSMPYSALDENGNRVISITLLHDIDTIKNNKFEFELYIASILLYDYVKLYKRFPNYKNQYAGLFPDDYDIKKLNITINSHADDNLFIVLILFGIIENSINKISSREYLEKILELFTNVISDNNYLYDEDDENIFDDNEPEDNVLSITDFNVKIIQEVLERFYGINQ